MAIGYTTTHLARAVGENGLVVTIDPSDAADVIAPVLVAVVLSLVLNVAAGLIAARMQGYGRGPAANIGLTVFF